MEVVGLTGNIGSGKTTLTRLLAKHYGWDTHFEDVEHNPYLNDFYEDMQRWSFTLQIYYLNSRFTQIQEIKETDKNVIQDRTIYEDAFIFAPNLHSMGLMTRGSTRRWSICIQSRLMKLRCSTLRTRTVDAFSLSKTT